MEKEYDRLVKARDVIKEILKKSGYEDFIPKVGVVLGSGLGGYGDDMESILEIPYRDIPGYQVSTVPGHDGKYILGYVGGVPVIAMKGRIHYYEGYDIKDVVMPIRVMGLLGIEILILTNAAGGIDLSFTPGDLMLITDQITGYVPSPLIGENIEELGLRFPDMSKIYDGDLIKTAHKVSGDIGLDIKEGVYLQASGPQFESPAEIRAFRALGASAVGMSTACEAIAARHMGLRILGISCISNMAAGILDQPLNHEEVQETADRVADSFKKLVTGIIQEL